MTIIQKSPRAALLALAIACALNAPAWCEDSQQLTTLGLRQARNGDDRAAAAAFTRAVIANPANLDARRYLAQIELRSGRALSAYKIMQATATANPSADNLACLADAEYALGKVGDAMRDYNQALTLNQFHYGASLGLSNIYIADQNYAGALHLCRTSLGRCADPAQADALRAKIAQIEALQKPIALGQS